MELFNTKDVYSVMNTTLMQKDYASCDNKTKKELVTSSFKDYFSYKLSQLHIRDDIDLDNLSINEIFKLLASAIDEDKRLEVLSHPIHYLLSLISLLQGFEVIWEIDNNLGESCIMFVEDERLDKIKTSQVIDITLAFNSVYDYYMKQGMVLDNKQYNLKKQK